VAVTLLTLYQYVLNSLHGENLKQSEYTIGKTNFQAENYASASIYTLTVTAFWDTTPYNLIALMMEAVRTSETSVYFVTTRRYIPEGCNLQIRRRDNVKSYLHFDLNFFTVQFYITSYLYNNKLTPWRKNPKVHHRITTARHRSLS
jgi:hypothetical protein